MLLPLLRGLLSCLVLPIVLNTSFALASEQGDKLTEAIKLGDTNRVRELLDQGADPNEPDAAHGNITPLARAAGHGHLEIMELLVQAKADLNRADDDGQTPLHHAVFFRGRASQPEAVKWLLERGADASIANKIGMTPRDRAIDIEVMKMFDDAVAAKAKPKTGNDVAFGPDAPSAPTVPTPATVGDGSGPGGEPKPSTAVTVAGNGAGTVTDGGSQSAEAVVLKTENGAQKIENGAQSAENGSESGSVEGSGSSASASALVLTNKSDMRAGSSAALVVQTNTGASLALGGKVTKGNPTGDAGNPGLTFSGNVLLGSSSGVNHLPVLNLDASARKALDDTFLGKSNPFILSQAKLNGVLGAGFERNVNLARLGQLKVYSGAEMRKMSEKGDTTTFWSLGALVEAGVAVTPGKVAPFLQLAFEAKGEVCFYLDDGRKHAVCFDGNSKAAAGIAQASIEAAGGISYKHKISDNPASFIRAIKVGPQAGFGASAAQGGSGAYGQGTFGVTIY